MAWQASVSSPTTIPSDPDNIYVTVNYYDDVTPANILYTRTFRFTSTTSKAEAQTAIIAAGQSARTTYNRVTTLSAQIPNGTVIAIP